MKSQKLLHRRQFLHTTARAAALATLGSKATFSGLSAEAYSPPVAVFSKVYQELKLSFEESAQMTVDAGLEGIDCAVRPGGEILPERAAEDMPRYAEALQKHRARMLLLTTAITGVSTPHAETILRTSKKLGIQHYRLGYWPRQAGKPPEELYQRIRAELKNLAALNGEIGICALFQNHSSDPGKSSGAAGGDLGEMYEIVKEFNPEQIGVAFDFGHALITHGDEWRGHFEKLKSHIRIAYIKDAKRPASFVPFGQGEFGRMDIFQRLKKMNYRRPFSMHIEFDWAGQGRPKSRAALVKTLRESQHLLRGWWAAA